MYYCVGFSNNYTGMCLKVLHPAVIYAKGATLHYGHKIVRVLCSVRRLCPMFFLPEEKI